MYTYVAFTDFVLAQIEKDVARFAPERGGALLGPVGQPVVTEFLYDEHARTSGGTFSPSRWLEARVQEREAASPLIEFKGILHSHPGAMSYPSSGDHEAYENSLYSVPWLGRLIAPIVTVGKGLSDGHHIPLLSETGGETGTMSVYVAEPTNGGSAGVVVQAATPSVIWLRRDLGELARELGGIADDPFIIEADGQAYLAGPVLCEGFDLLLLFGPTYPFTAPVAVAARRPEATELVSHELLGVLWAGEEASAERGLPLLWDLAEPDETRLREALLRPALMASLVPQAGSTGTSPEDSPRDAEILVPAGPVAAPPAQVRAPWAVRMARRAWRRLSPRTWRRPRWAVLPAGRHERSAASPAVTAGAPDSTDSPESELATMETGRTSDE
jgi:proteasome lid subunit RPN8/RPN11